MNEERCVYCGDIIPEGRQVCPQCEWEHIYGRSSNRKREERVMHMDPRQAAKDLGVAMIGPMTHNEDKVTISLELAMQLSYICAAMADIMDKTAAPEE